MRTAPRSSSPASFFMEGEHEARGRMEARTRVDARTGSRMRMEARTRVWSRTNTRARTRERRYELMRFLAAPIRRGDKHSTSQTENILL